MPGYVGYVNKILGLASSYAGLSEPLTAVPSSRSNSPAFYNGSWKDGKPHVGVNTDVPGSLKGAHMSAKTFLENMESYGIPKEIISQIDITKPEDMLPLITAHEMGHHVDHQNRGDAELSADNVKAKEFKRLRLEAEASGDMETAAKWAREYRNVASEKNADTFAFNFIRDKYQEIWPKKDWSGVPKVSAGSVKPKVVEAPRAVGVTKPDGPYADYVDYVLKKIDEEQGIKPESSPVATKNTATVGTEATKATQKSATNPVDIPKAKAQGPESFPTENITKKTTTTAKPTLKPVAIPDAVERASYSTENTGKKVTKPGVVGKSAGRQSYPTENPYRVNKKFQQNVYPTENPNKKITVQSEVERITRETARYPAGEPKNKVILPDKVEAKVAKAKLDDAAKDLTKRTGNFGKGAILAVGSLIAVASVADYVMDRQDEMRMHTQVQRQEHMQSEKMKNQLKYQSDAYNGPAPEPFTEGLPQFLFNNRKSHSNTWGGQKY